MFKESKKTILSITEFICNKKDVFIDPTNLAFKNSIMLYCNELPSGIISSNCFLNIETMNIIFPYDDYYDYSYGLSKDDYYAETTNLESLQHYLSNTNIDHSLIHESDQDHVNM